MYISISVNQGFIFLWHFLFYSVLCSYFLPYGIFFPQLYKNNVKTMLSEGNGNPPHSSILAWRIPWMEEPDGLQSIGSQRVRHD